MVLDLALKGFSRNTPLSKLIIDKSTEEVAVSGTSGSRLASFDDSLHRQTCEYEVQRHL